MCDFLSGLVTIEKHPRILCQNLTSHDATVNALRIAPETYREWEWTREDGGESLNVRVLPGEDRAEFWSAILALYPRRILCINECLRQIAEGGRNVNLDLSGLTSAEGLTLPQSVGGSLRLSGLTSAEGLTLPQSVGGDIYLSGLTSAEGLTLPQSVGGSLRLSGLTSAEGLTLPKKCGFVDLKPSVRRQLQAR